MKKLHTQNEIESYWNETLEQRKQRACDMYDDWKKSKEAHTSSVSAGCGLSLYAEMEDLAERCEERAKALEATLEDECDGSEQTRYRWKIKAGMFRSIGMEVKQRLRSWKIHQNNE